MLNQLVTLIAQEPPVPEPSETPDILPTPMIYIAIVIVVAGIIAWKYKAIPEFIIIVCSTIGGFIVGFIATPPYGNVGLGMMVAMAGLLLSIAVVTLVRTVLKTRRVATATA
jgi:hypothetical protein